MSIDQFVLEENILHINANIWAASRSQKKIIIGKDGSVLKVVGEQARKDMEGMFGHKVFLQTWVKVKKKWVDDIQALKQLGYHH